jgi:hypothetical protein
MQPHCTLLWGLVYESRRHSGSMEVLRLDTLEKMEAFCSLLGKTVGYGVRKKRPKYSDDKSLLLHINDVINIILCPSSLEGVGSNNDESVGSFQWFGVKEDGIDLSYDFSEGILQFAICYQKMVIMCESLDLFGGVGVSLPVAVTAAPTVVGGLRIAPGIEFFIGEYVMRVHQVCNGGILVRKAYKVDGGSIHGGGGSELVFYHDVANVHSRI